ncbi:14167_t:CDS:1, partial [Acaulospora morrowiae]
VDAIEIANKRKLSQIMLRSPNAFLIYRKVFLDHLSSFNHCLKMTEVSKLVSVHWRNEPEKVKEAYKKIAHEVEVELNERRKRNVSFCRVVWKNSKLLERKKKRKATMKKRQSTGVDFGNVGTDAIPNRLEEDVSFSREETSSEDIYSNSISGSRKNSIDKIRTVDDFAKVIEYDLPDENTLNIVEEFDLPHKLEDDDIVNFEYDNKIAFYLQNFLD